jgi:hypothetical protein
LWLCRLGEPSFLPLFTKYTNKHVNGRGNPLGAVVELATVTVNAVHGFLSYNARKGFLAGCRKPAGLECGLDPIRLCLGNHT